MRRVAVILLVMCGCDTVFGLDPTGHNAVTCDPLPFDPNRYMAIPPSGNWQSARAACKANGYDLAVLDEDDAQELANEVHGTVAPFWLGVSYAGGTWSSIDSCPPELGWAPNEPGVPSDGDCVVQGDTGMANVACSSVDVSIGALCEAPRPSAQCAAFALQRTYALITSTLTNGVSCNDGELMCAAMGAGWHLVELNSTDEIEYLRTHEASGVPEYWIGSKRTMSGWTSPTGCPQIFMWNSGAPMDNNGNCADYQGVMQDAGCGDSAADPVICEKNVEM